MKNEFRAAESWQRSDDAGIDLLRGVVIKRNRVEAEGGRGLEALTDQFAVLRVCADILVLGHAATRHKRGNSNSVGDPDNDHV